MFFKASYAALAVAGVLDVVPFLDAAPRVADRPSSQQRAAPAAVLRAALVWGCREVWRVLRLEFAVAYRRLVQARCLGVSSPAAGLRYRFRDRQEDYSLAARAWLKNRVVDAVSLRRSRPRCPRISGRVYPLRDRLGVFACASPLSRRRPPSPLEMEAARGSLESVARRRSRLRFASLQTARPALVFDLLRVLNPALSELVPALWLPGFAERSDGARVWIRVPPRSGYSDSG